MEAKAGGNGEEVRRDLGVRLLVYRRPERKGALIRGTRYRREIADQEMSRGYLGHNTLMQSITLLSTLFNLLLDLQMVGSDHDQVTIL